MGMPGEQAQRDSGQRALRRERRHANAQRGQDRLGPASACRWASSCSNMGCAAERAFSARRRCQAARAAHAERETGGHLDLTQGFAQRRWGLVQRLRRHAQAGALVLQGQQFGVAKAQAANALLRSVVAGGGVHGGGSESGWGGGKGGGRMPCCAALWPVSVSMRAIPCGSAPMKTYHSKISPA